MKRRREMIGQDLVSGPWHQRRVAAEQVVDIFGEASGDAEVPCLPYVEIIL